MVKKTLFRKKFAWQFYFFLSESFFCDKKGSLNRLQKVQFW